MLVSKQQTVKSTGRLTRCRALCIGLLVLLSLVPFLSTIFTSILRDSEFKPIVFSNGHATRSNVQLTLWSSDFHISPVADAKHVLEPLNTKIVEKSLSSHCHLTKSCQRDLRVINADNGIDLSPCPNTLRREFYESYRCDSEFNSVDAILCTHACSMCELFMPFDKPLIVIASTRYEIGRYKAVEWTEWNRNLIRIASKPGNIVAANNLYDLEYIKYFTPIKNVVLLPSYCGYVQASYAPTKRTLLIAPARDADFFLSNRIKKMGRRHNYSVADLHDAYPHYEYSDLAAHPAFILLPYQVSFMTFFELYRMAIPMFVPSPELLTDWHVERRVLKERTWSSVFGSLPHRSNIPKHPQSTSKLNSDPNDDFTRESILEWVRLSDFYQFPNVTTFSSIQNLFDIMPKVDLKAISLDMEKFNTKQKSYISETWVSILNGVIEKKNQQHSFSPLFNLRYSLDLASSCPAPIDVNDALQLNYGFHLPHAESCRASPSIDVQRPGSKIIIWLSYYIAIITDILFFAIKLIWEWSLPTQYGSALVAIFIISGVVIIFLGLFYNSGGNSKSS